MGRKRSLIAGLAFSGAVAFAGMGFTGCHRPPLFCGGEYDSENFPKHVLERIDSEVAELKLTDAQQAQYREIRSRLENELIEAVNQRKAFFKKVKAEMDHETPDLKVLSALLKSRVDNFPVRADMLIDNFMAFYNMLDENQKAVITTQLKKKFEILETLKALMAS